MRQVAVSLLPATYAADGYYTVIYGGGNLTGDMLALLLVTGVTLAAACIRTLWSGSKLHAAA